MGGLGKETGRGQVGRARTSLAPTFREGAVPSMFPSRGIAIGGEQLIPVGYHQGH